VWNNIDKRITKYHVEAADNAKFLGAIEKTSHSIYLEDPGQMKESLMRVLHIVKVPICFFKTYQLMYTLEGFDLPTRRL
jgi:hypothetical protein